MPQELQVKVSYVHNMFLFFIFQQRVLLFLKWLWSILLMEEVIIIKTFYVNNL